jgi:hypothetical protein
MGFFESLSFWLLPDSVDSALFSPNRNEDLLFRAGHRNDNRALKKLEQIDREEGGTKWVDDAIRRRNL